MTYEQETSQSAAASCSAACMDFESELLYKQQFLLWEDSGVTEELSSSLFSKDEDGLAFRRRQSMVRFNDKVTIHEFPRVTAGERANVWYTKWEELSMAHQQEDHRQHYYNHHHEKSPTFSELFRMGFTLTLSLFMLLMTWIWLLPTNKVMQEL